MKFTKDSEQLMEIFINNFSVFLPKYNPSQQKHIDLILKSFYQDIRKADVFVSSLWSDEKIRSNIHRGRVGVPKTVLLNSKYVPAANRRFIEDNVHGYISYKVTLRRRKIAIYFAILSPADFERMDLYHNYVHFMLTWLELATQHASRVCGRTLSVFCYPTPFKKYLPRHQYNTIGPEHCNSALTTSCVEDGEICIFRKEEIMKVFIHETFHILGLDFSAMRGESLRRNMRKLFPIRSEYNMHEAYSEFWASTMNAILSAYFINDNRSNKQSFILYSNFCMRIEQIFSLFQCVKVLDFMHMEYTALFRDDEASKNSRTYMYKEESNVFAYYIIKALLLYYNCDFMVWCKKYNTSILQFHKTNENLNRFYNFIKSHYKRPEFIADLKRIHKRLRKIKQKEARESTLILQNNLRMSVSELE